MAQDDTGPASDIRYIRRNEQVSGHNTTERHVRPSEAWVEREYDKKGLKPIDVHSMTNF
jgi:hypothetical protein